MDIEEQPVGVPFDARQMAVDLINGTESQPQGEAAVEGQPDEGGNTSESDLSPEDPDGDPAKKETPEKEGKKPGRSQKLKQRAQAAEAQVTDLTDKVHEALDHVAHFESENTVLREEMQAMYALLDENGLGYSAEQMQLREFQAKDRRNAHEKTAQEAISQRKTDLESKTQVDSLHAELVEAGEQSGLEWMQIARHMQVYQVGTVEAVAALTAAKPAAKASEAVLQARKNKSAPAVMRQSDGDTAKRDFKPGGRAEAAQLLRDSGLFK